MGYKIIRTTPSGIKKVSGVTFKTKKKAKDAIAVSKEVKEFPKGTRFTIK